MTNSSSTPASVVNVHWPLYTVYPAAIVFFYCAYFLFIPLGIRLAVAISLLAFWVLLGLSVFWWCRDVPPGIKAATEDMWGEGYWKGKWWCPWFCQEEEREKRRERRRRRAALNELKRERDAEMKKADVQIVSRTFDGGQSSA